MAQCSAVKPNGGRSERIVGVSHGYCYAHDPRHSEERQCAASRAGKSKGNRALREIREQLKTLAEDVLAGRVDRADAIAVNQCLNTLLRALEMERKWEVEERERRASEEDEDSLGDVAEHEWIARLLESERAGTETPDHVTDRSLEKSAYSSYNGLQ